MLVIFFRSIIVYFVVIFAVRLMGKRQLGELQPSELAITILISNIATLSIEEIDTPVFMGLLPILTLVSIEVIVSVINLHNPRIRRIFSGSPVVVIQYGTIDQAKLHMLRYSVDDLLSQLRTQNIFDVSEVDFAVVETTGQLTVYQKYSHRTVTPEVIGMEDIPKKDAPPLPVICHGHMNYAYLALTGKDEKWIMQQLGSHNLNITQVYLMTVDKEDNINIIREDR